MNGTDFSSQEYFDAEKPHLPLTASRSLAASSLGSVVVYLAMVCWLWEYFDVHAVRLSTGNRLTAATAAGAGFMMTGLHFVGCGCRTPLPLRHAIIVSNLLCAITNALTALYPVPVVFDQYTGCNVFLLRWVEWFVLSFHLTFITEIISLCHYIRASPELYRLVMNDANLPNCIKNAVFQCLSTSAGLIMPFMPNRWCYLAVLSASCALFATLFPRLMRMHQNLREEKHVTKEQTVAFQLQLTCACTVCHLPCVHMEHSPLCVCVVAVVCLCPELLSANGY